MKHFEHYNILTDCQHGFRSKRSTELQLILTIQDIASSLQQNKSIHAAVLDFSKAFDKVPHQRLLMKLERYGIHGNLLQFNPSKCNIICISNKQSPPQRTYFFCGSKLEQVDMQTSYLGITVNSKLKWSEHISSISSKAS